MTLTVVLLDLVPVAVGFAFGLIPLGVRRISSMRGACRAAAQAMLVIAEDAEEYLTAGISSPLYRTTADLYENALAPLIHAGALSDNQYRTLIRYGNIAEQMNRGLDQVHEFRAAGNTKAMNEEKKRLRIKAVKLVREGAESLYPDAVAVLSGLSGRSVRWLW